MIKLDPRSPLARKLAATMDIPAPTKGGRPSLIEWRNNPRERVNRKYKNVPTEIDGQKFDSKAEANRWCALQQLLKAGEIRNLERQVSYVLLARQKRPSGGFERAVVYIADFCYTDRTGKRVVEDVKGCSTDVWVIKRKLMLSLFGIEVREIKA